MPPTYDVNNTPPLYHGLIHQWGAPLGIEESRQRWSELVKAATAGTVTLIARDVPDRGPQWTALVPLSEVADPPADCPVWPLLSARKKLGDLVDQAARWPSGRTQLLSNHRTLVAALVPASVLVDRHGERIDIEKLLRDGGAVSIAYYPGEHGSVGADGEVTVDPEDEAFVATASDRDGTTIGQGQAPTIAEAMMRLTRYRPWSAEEAAAYGYSTEPPF